MKKTLSLIAILLAAFVTSAVPQQPDANLQGLGAPRGRALTGPELDARTDAVGSQLRCPVCQGLSITDSPAAMAVNMKKQVRDFLAAGYDEEQILAYFERSYGEFVRLEPPARGVNWIVWLAPIVILIGGAAILARVIRRSRSAVIPEASTEIDRDVLPDDDRLAPYVLRIRELAYGWPGGKSPKGEAE